MTLATPVQFDQIARTLERVGFEHALAGSPSCNEYISRIAYNAFISMIIYARNNRALRRDTLTRGRFLFLMSRATLDRNFGSAGRLCRLPVSRE